LKLIELKEYLIKEISDEQHGLLQELERHVLELEKRNAEIQALSTEVRLIVVRNIECCAE
jgi:hypothetical protein